MNVQSTRRNRIGFVLSGLFFAFITSNAYATNYFVDPNGNDSNTCLAAGTTTACKTLQGVIDKASTTNSSDTITLAAGTYTASASTVFDSSAGPKSYKVVGAGFNSTFFDGQNQNNIVISQSITVDLSGITIKNGKAGGTSQGGGGIRNAGTLVLHESVIQNCQTDQSQAGQGGGIGNIGNLTVINSTISGNIADRNGGGIANGGSKIAGSPAPGTLVVVNSTISGNSVRAGGGGGIYNESCTDVTCTSPNSTAILLNATITGNTSVATTGEQVDGGGGVLIVSGSVTANNSIIAGNTDTSSKAAPDCFGTLTSNAGHDLIQNTNGCTLSGTTTGNITGKSAGLDSALKDNGGNHIPTFALLSGSPAIDAGVAPSDGGCRDQNGTTQTTDERSQPRPLAGITGNTAICDLGAFEAAAGTSPPNNGGGGGGGGCALQSLESASSLWGSGLLGMMSVGLLGWIRRRS